MKNKVDYNNEVVISQSLNEEQS